MILVRQLVREKETKNSVRFQEVVPPGEEGPVFGAGFIYLSRALVGDAKEIRVKVEIVEGTGASQ